jgi:FkbM family methyltransferase
MKNGTQPFVLNQPIDGASNNSYYLAMRIFSWPKAAVRRLRRAFYISSIYGVCFGRFRGLVFFARAFCMPWASERLVDITAPDSSMRLRLRLGSTDIYVFNSIYHKQEYGWDFTEPPEVIVDAGAYTGLSTAFFAMRYPDAQIIAIEPDPGNYDLLIKNTAGFGNVRTIRAALWGESGSVNLTDPGAGSWGLRLAANVCNNPASPIQAITVNDIMQEYHIDRIDLLKLDIEGSEKEVFANSDSWIENIEAICIELHDRFKVGCSRAFFKAVDEFPIELWHSEDILVLRERSRLGALIAPRRISVGATTHRDKHGALPNGRQHG